MAMSESTVIRDAQPGADDDAVVQLMTDYMTWAHERRWINDVLTTDSRHPALTILKFGTYLAQRPAFCRSWPRTAAHPARNQDRESRTFPLVIGVNLRLW
jgi:hypothetical protein